MGKGRIVFAFTKRSWSSKQQPWKKTLWFGVPLSFYPLWKGHTRSKEPFEIVRRSNSLLQQYIDKASSIKVKVMGCEKCRMHILACKNSRLEKESEVRHSRRLRHQISNLWKQWVQNQELHIEQDSMTQFNFLVIIVSHAEHWLNFNRN